MEDKNMQKIINFMKTIGYELNPTMEKHCSFKIEINNISETSYYFRKQRSDASKSTHGCGEAKVELENRVCWRKRLCDDCMRLRKGCGELFERDDDVGMTRCGGRTLCPKCDAVHAVGETGGKE